MKTFAGVLGGRQRCPIVRLGVPPRKVRREHFRGTSPRPAEKQARRARCPAADGPGKTFAGVLGGRQRCPIVRLGVPPRKVRREDFRETSPRPAERDPRGARGQPCPPRKVRRKDLRGTSRRTKTMHLRQSIPPLHIGRAHPTWASAKKIFATATIGKKQHRRAGRLAADFRGNLRWGHLSCVWTVRGR